MGRPDDAGLVKYKSMCFQYASCFPKILLLLLPTNLFSYKKEKLPFFFHFLEFTREVTDTQMPLVAPVILPEMYKIFTMAEV